MPLVLILYTLILVVTKCRLYRSPISLALKPMFFVKMRSLLYNKIRGKIVWPVYKHLFKRITIVIMTMRLSLVQILVFTNGYHGICRFHVILEVPLKKVR